MFEEKNEDCTRYLGNAQQRWYVFCRSFPVLVLEIIVNQFTCVGVNPVAWASSRFLLGFG